MIPTHPLLLTLAGALVCAGGRPPARNAVAFVNVSVLAVDANRMIPGQTVVVENGVITRIGDARTMRVPAGMSTIEGTGRYLIPGLVDVHVHLASNPEPEQHELLKLFLVNGVTTVLNMRGTPQILELRAAVEAGRVLGPRIYSVGPYINEPFVTTPDEVERAVVEQKRAGYDFVKLHGNLSREAYAQLNAVARGEGIRVIGHAPRNLGVEAMFAERQYAVVHAEEFLYDKANRATDSSLPYVEARVPEFTRAMAREAIWLMPNLTAYKMIARQVQDLGAVLGRPEMNYLPATVRMGWGPETNPYTNRIAKSRYQPMMAKYRLLEKLVGAFQAGGVRLLVGTDAMNTGVVPGFSVHDELADLVSAGLTPSEALRSATVNAAAFLGDERGTRQGTVAVGQSADLVLLEANPLVDIANTRRIAGVMLRGRWFSQSDISALLRTLQ